MKARWLLCSRKSRNEERDCSQPGRIVRSFVPLPYFRQAIVRFIYALLFSWGVGGWVCGPRKNTDTALLSTLSPLFFFRASLH